MKEIRDADVDVGLVYAIDERKHGINPTHTNAFQGGAPAPEAPMTRITNINTQLKQKGFRKSNIDIYKRRRG